MDRTSEPEIPKSIPIKGPGCKSGGCAVKVVRLTSGDLRRVRWWTEETVRSPDRVAEVSRGHSRSWRPKARTGGVVSRSRALEGEGQPTLWGASWPGQG